MNVIVANNKRDLLSDLDIDIIKSIYGEYEASEITEMFKSFFYNKMILDVTAIKGFNNIDNYKEICNELDPEKIIFFLPEGSEVCTSSFISNLIDNGIYNFTTNIDGVKYLLKNPNTYDDVSNLVKTESKEDDSNISINNKVIGFKNLTDKAGATTLIYMLMKELKSQIKSRVVAVEVEKNDFSYFNEEDMISVSSDKLKQSISKYEDDAIVLVDLNSLEDKTICEEIIYIIEPSMISLNKLIRKNRSIFTKLKDEKIILNKSLLNNKDVNDFEYEAKVRIFFNMPPLDERKKNPILTEFLGKLELIETNENGSVNNNKIFGLFRR